MLFGPSSRWNIVSYVWYHIVSYVWYHIVSYVLYHIVSYVLYHIVSYVWYVWYHTRINVEWRLWMWVGTCWAFWGHCAPYPPISRGRYYAIEYVWYAYDTKYLVPGMTIYHEHMTCMMNMIWCDSVCYDMVWYYIIRYYIIPGVQRVWAKNRYTWSSLDQKRVPLKPS